VQLGFLEELEAYCKKKCIPWFYLYHPILWLKKRASTSYPLTSIQQHTLIPPVLLLLAVSFNNNNNDKFILRRKMQKQTQNRGHCTSAKHMTSILRHVTEAFPSAMQGTILNSHRVIGIATNTSMVINCALVTYI